MKITLQVLLGLFLSLSPVLAADFYWKGGSGNFNDPNMWAIDSLAGPTASQSPISVDNVFFEAAAFTAPGAIIDITANASCRNFVVNNSIPLANAPTLRGTNAALNLDVFGDFTLHPAMIWAFNGNLRFVSVAAAGTIHRIRTNGRRILANSIVIMPTNMVEYRLLDDLYLDDPAQANANLSQGQLFFNSGYLNSNGQDIRADGFTSVSNSLNRRLKLDGSRFEVTRDDRFHGMDWVAWNVDWNADVRNYDDLSFQGSHILVTATRTSWVEMGRGIRYDSMTFARQFTTPNVDVAPLLTYVSGLRDTFNYLAIYRRVGANPWTVTANELHLYPAAHFGAVGTLNLSTEQVIVHGGCHSFPTIGSSGLWARSAGNGWNGTVNLSKTTPGVLNLSQLILGRVNANITGGRTYVAANCADKGGNNNILFSPVAARALFFRNTAGNPQWHSLGNWAEWNGSSFVAATCLPTPFDDVYFDDLSFTQVPTEVRIDSNAVCRAMRWLNTTPMTGARFRLNAFLHMFGTLAWSPVMVNGNFAGNSNLILCSPLGDSLISNNVVNNATNITLDNNADYHIHGNYTGRMFGGPGSMMRMQADTLRPVESFNFSRAVYNGTQIFVNNTVFNGCDPVTYTGNATLHLLNTSGTRHSIWVCNLPYVIAYTGSRYDLIGTNRVWGNLSLQEDAYLCIGQPGNRSGSLNVSGGLNGATGNVSISRGGVLEYGNFTSTSSVIAGNLTALGDCQKTASIRSFDGQSLAGGFRVLGTAIIDRAYLLGINNTSPAPNSPLIALNSLNGGNNSNISFTSSTSQTYYWRARAGNPSQFTGAWSDAGHWTTNPANTTGDSLCVPSGFDDVVFDNLSFDTLAPSTNNGCSVTNPSFCRDIRITAGARFIIAGGAFTCRNFEVTSSQAILESSTVAQQIFITDSLTLAPNMANMRYRGDINMTGSGAIRCNGTQLQVRRLILNNPTGVWHLRDDLFLSNDWAGTNATNALNGELRIAAGALYTNDYTLTISSFFNATVTTTRPRALHLGRSRVVHRIRAPHHSNGVDNWPWNITTTNFTLTFQPDAELIFGQATLFNVANTRLDFFMGNLNYPRVRIVDNDQPINLYGNANYNFLELEGNVYVDGNNRFDSLRLEGGYFYRFRNGSLQTLNAPHGRIIANGTSSAFVNIESSVAGAPFTLRKPFGPAFCIDFVKVRDCIGQKESNLALVPTSPVDYVFMHPFLEFQTGVNSDNIGGTATGIWAFSLPPLVTPQRTGGNLAQICMLGSPNVFPMQFTGTSPYIVDYTWTDAGGNSGSATWLINDDDNNTATPYTHNFPLPSNQGPVVFQTNVRTSRCGDLTPNNLSSLTVTLPSPNLLVSVPRGASCNFNNEGTWLTLVDDTEQKPILSLRDSVNASDNQALGRVDINVFFDPTVQTWSDGINTYPYLQRHWQVRPTNNGPALVRLYFTQAELTALGLAGLFNPNISASPLDIQVRKFSGNGVGVGTMQIVPHTVIALTGANALPFSSTAGVIGIEFEVSSFSHFIITPTDAALLPLDLLRFQAQALPNRQVALNWRLASESEYLSHFELERSRDLQSIEYLAEVAATGALNYESLDPRPYSGTSYYRLSGVNTSGERKYSAWQAVEIEGDKILSLYPNPAQGGQAWLRLDSPQGGRLQVRFFDALGRQALSLSLDAEAGQSLQSLNLSQLAPGLYQVQVLLPDNQSYTQFLRVD